VTNAWPVISLGTLCEVLDSRRKPITKSNRIPGPIPYYGASGVLDYVDGFLFDEKLVLLGEDGAKWQSGDRSAFIIDGKSWVNNHAHALRPMPDKLTHEWLTYFLISTDLSEYITGVTVPKLNQERMRSIPIPLPPLDEQKRIVAKLDEAMSAIRETQASCEVLKTLSDSYVKEVTRRILASNENDWTTGVMSDFFYMYQPQTISGKELIPDGEFVVYGANGPIGRYFEYNHEDSEVTMTCRGATCGTVNVTPPKVWITGNAMVIRPTVAGLSKEFVAAVLPFMDYRSAITGSAQPQITRTSLNPIPFRFPSAIEQTRIVESLRVTSTHVDDFMEIQRRKNESVEQLKATVLAAAFAGAL